MDNAKIVIDAKVSGRLKNMYRLPDGRVKDIRDEGGNAYEAWENEKKPRTFKLNVMQIEYFQKQTYPIVKVECRKKNISSLGEFWYKDWNDSKIYDVEITKVGEKTVTMVKLASGKTIYLDNDVSEIENALNGVCGV